MTVGLSLVGLQPSATAAALKTWIRNKGKLDRVLLLATARVRQDGQATRLKSLLATWDCDADIEGISDTLEPNHSLPSAPEFVRHWLKDIGRDSRVVFCGDPGPKFLLVSVAQVLPPETIFLHADTEHLHCGTIENHQERWERYALQNLEMDAQLALYDLAWETNPDCVSPELIRCLQRHHVHIPSRIQQGFRFKEIDALPTLDLAYEKGGWFFGLCFVNDLEKVRVAERISHELLGLRPILTMVAGNPTLRTQIRTARFQAISPASGTTLQNWVAGRVPPPGREIISDAQKPPRPLKGCSGEGSGPPLILWMGTDPSATLVSLCTHRPRQAWVLYDTQTPAAVEMTRRLRECSGKLPVGNVTFIASDLLGRGVVSSLHQQLSRTRNVKADITPGRKAQGVALGRLPGVQLWSLRTPQGKAVPLLPGVTPLQLEGPELITQVRLSGGRLFRTGDDAKAWNPSFRDFLLLLGRFVAATVLEKQERVRLDPLTDMECHLGKLSVSDNLITVKYEGKQRRNTLNPRGGYWFERVVASAFVAVRADEVRVGVRWAWPPNTLPPTKHSLAAFRADVDVVARFGPRFFVVSCKVGQRPTLASAAREVEAVASKLVGRLVVPLVVRPRIDPAKIEERRRSRQGAAYLDLALLCDPDRLEEILHEIWSARSTLGE